MSFFRDKQIKKYCLFIVVYALLILGAVVWICQSQIAAAKSMYLRHDTAIVSSLLEQGVSEETIANAISSTESAPAAAKFLDSLGIRENTMGRLLPFLSQFQSRSLMITLFIGLVLIIILFIGTSLFLGIRNRLYLQAEEIVNCYINNDYSRHLPQLGEGEIFRLFASIERLATMLQSKNENEHKTKEFMKRTISDISHQLKTPLAALTMYQEIIEAEPEHVETVKEFSAKARVALKRMEQLILSMLKITRLDAGNITFEIRRYPVKEVIENAISELTTRSRLENKEIVVDGDPQQPVFCDMDWTGEAIGNLVKNALDHTKAGDIIHITWENAPTMLRILITDNGSGIAPEDIHHIFKRFYRSKRSLDTQGIGLGLSLAKSIIEGQGGIISVQSVLNEGTTFTLSFLTKS